MLTSLDESLHHQASLTFDQVVTTDHRFYDRQLMGGFRTDGEVAFLAGITLFKNMNVMEGFVLVQFSSEKQYNIRLTRQLRPMPDHTANIGPLSFAVHEAFKELRFALDAGDFPVTLDATFHSVLPPRLEHPHQSRGDGRLHTDYLRYNQLGRISAKIEVEGHAFVGNDWFGWRDHSWGVRPGVGGFEPMTGTASSGGVASASRTGGKGLFLLHAGFRAGEVGGAIQVIEDGEGRRIFTEGEIRDGEGDPSEVSDIQHDISFLAGTRVFDTAKIRIDCQGGRSHELSAKSIGRPWAYMGGGYDGGFNDGLGQGVWRSKELAIETDTYDISDPELVILPDGRALRPKHREQLAACTVDGQQGYAYMPMFVIGSQPRFGLPER